jgi:Phage tail tube protein, TTP/Ubiquitin-activating enzyme E1 FCCH domain
MPSTAISAQGTSLKAGVTASAKTITAITKANPGVFTSSAHGLTPGQVIVITGVVGMTEVNNKAGVVGTVPSANTFTIAGLDTTNATTYTSGGSATPTQVTIGNLKSVPLPGGQKSELETTNLGSTSKEFIAGLRDNGQATVGFDVDQDDQGQQVLRSSFAASGSIASTWLVTLPNGKTRTFNAFVTNYGEPQIGVDQVFMGSVTLRITGDITYA